MYVVRKPAKPNDGEFYHADLLGMSVKGQDGVPLGNLIAIHDFGAGEIAELAPVKKRSWFLLAVIG